MVASHVVRIARDPTLFRFLSACGPDMRIVLGDARLTLAASPERYDLIVLDAFSSDAIPVHLLTREAFAGYLSRLTARGVIVLHISNRHMALWRPAAAVGGAEGLVAYGKGQLPPDTIDDELRVRRGGGCVCSGCAGSRRSAGAARMEAPRSRFARSALDR